MNMWEKVQIRMNDNKKNASNKAKSEYLLSGLIECEKCGSKYVGHTRTNSKGCKTRYYICGNKYRTHTCDAKNLNADVIEADIVQQLKAWFKEADYTEQVDAMIEAYKNASNDHSKEIQELKEVKFKISNCINAITTGLDYPELRDTLAALQVRKNDLEDLIVSSPLKALVNRDYILEQIKKDAEEFNISNTKQFVKEYIQKIYTHDDNLTTIIGVHTTGSSGRT